MPTLSRSSEIKEEAARLGFTSCGIAKAEQLHQEADLLGQWLDNGHHATMEWMSTHANMRTNPELLFENARSIISVTHSYYSDNYPDDNPETGRISRYAWNKDYHRILRKKLSTLLKWMDKSFGPISGRAFVDSAPIMDKVWAQRSGLGWIGKHSNVISKQHGSYFFIGELIVDIELDYDEPEVDHCGSCTRCLDACPTDAIVEPFVVDAGRCISYATIEHSGPIEDNISAGMGNWIFGCDICQEVCPWNKFSILTSEPRFAAVDERMNTNLADWQKMTEEEFNTKFAGSAVKRTGYDGFMRNVKIAYQNMIANDTLDV